MEMEMEMRAKEDIERGQDITPPIPPLSFALHHSLLHTHCSACFSPLPHQPFPPLLSASSSTHVLLYCSSQCSALDSSLHFSSAEYHLLHLLHSNPLLSTHLHDSTDLRVALRFLHSHRAQWQSGRRDRVAGLITNRDKLMANQDDQDGENEIRDKIRAGSRAMAAAKAMRDGLGDLNRFYDALLKYDDDVFHEEVAALCLVLTNAVEVHDNFGRTIGVGVYGLNFCWINHSCSPNSCYRVALSSPSMFCGGSDRLRILPYSMGGKEIPIGDNCELEEDTKQGRKEPYGPRMIVRSIRKIRKGEEVTIAYTDLLQTKAMRQIELWSRYRFLCSCCRCNASPLSFVDQALQEVSGPDVTNFDSDFNIDKEDGAKLLIDHIEDVIFEYLSSGDPEFCYQKLERLLSHGLGKFVVVNEGKLVSTLKLSPLHHISLNAYTTLASAYKVNAIDLLSRSAQVEEKLHKAFHMHRASAAYSLLLAGATHFLFCCESSLIVSVANFWISAGESLLTLARSPGWEDRVKSYLALAKTSCAAKFRCPRCSLIYKSNTDASLCIPKTADFEYISRKFLDCATHLTSKVWSFLTDDNHFLRFFKDPFDFRWRESSTAASDAFPLSGVDGNTAARAAVISTDKEWIDIFELSVHCLLYGGYLASLCYGHQYHLTNHDALQIIYLCLKCVLLIPPLLWKKVNFYGKMFQVLRVNSSHLLQTMKTRHVTFPSLKSMFLSTTKAKNLEMTCKSGASEKPFLYARPFGITAGCLRSGKSQKVPRLIGFDFRFPGMFV